MSGESDFFPVNEIAISILEYRYSRIGIAGLVLLTVGGMDSSFGLLFLSILIHTQKSAENKRFGLRFSISGKQGVFDQFLIIISIMEYRYNKKAFPFLMKDC